MSFIRRSKSTDKLTKSTVQLVHGWTSKQNELFLGLSVESTDLNQYTIWWFSAKLSEMDVDCRINSKINQRL
jgi:hypothetical protein